MELSKPYCRLLSSSTQHPETDGSACWQATANGAPEAQKGQQQEALQATQRAQEDTGPVASLLEFQQGKVRGFGQVDSAGPLLSPWQSAVRVLDNSPTV